MRIGVIGAGAIGLSSAIRLLEAGHDVEIITRDDPMATCSAVAAAFWYPSTVGPAKRVLPWGKENIAVYRQFSQKLETGISFAPLLELFKNEVPDPWWKSALEDFSHKLSPDLPPGFAYGHYATVALLDIPRHYPFLLQLFHRLGGKLRRECLNSIQQLDGTFEIVINCSGARARDLTPDPEVYAIRGQVVRIKKPISLEPAIWVDSSKEGFATYIVPRKDDCILGGTFQTNDWNENPDPAIAEGILERCCVLIPDLKNASILEHRVGLRPGRKEVRLEVERPATSCPIIHNYGHGGSGWTLNWGCAREVVDLAEKMKR
jgi:D-amino-acid oxidase